MVAQSILITGASGYIGGAVLSQIRSLPLLQDIGLFALVRSADHAGALKAIGVKPVHFEGLHDLSTIKRTASQHDIIISCASAMDLPSCAALVEGLGLRKAETGGDVFYIHTSGTSNFGDHRLSGKEDMSVHTDIDNIFEWEKATADDWILRAVDVRITELGLELGVKTHIVNPPLIYGTGDGLLNKHSLQIPLLLKASSAIKQAVVVGDGKGIWNVVHISDVAKIYEILVQKIVEGESIPYGKEGYYFIEAGEITWQDISTTLAREGHKAGFFLSTDVKSLSPNTFAEKLGIPFINGHVAEVIWASNSRIKGVKSRALGWAPTRPDGDFCMSLREEVRSYAESVAKAM